MIKIYRSSIDDFTQADYTKQYSLLDVALRNKIDAKKQNEQKKCSLVGYILLYRGIYELFGKKKFEITFSKYGKPLCDFCFFNISHSNKQVVCAISDKPIGVDIQKIKDQPYRDKYKFFTDKENKYVNETSDLLSLRYTEIFTKKESAIKLLGETILHGGMVDTFSKDFVFDTKFDAEYVLTICTSAKS